MIEAHAAAARGRVRVGYALVSGENILSLLWPFAIGLAIDGLVDGRWLGLAFFIALALTHTAVGFARQRYQTRTFNRLYADIATDVVEQQRGAGVDMASVSGRTALAGEYVEFLEHDVPLAITAGFTIVGSLVMIFAYDPAVGVVAAAIAIPVVLINRWLMARSEVVFRDLNDLAEVEVDVIGRGRRTESLRHFGRISRQWVRLSDSEAASWGVVEVVAVGLWAFALVRAATGALDIGGIIALLAYVWFYTLGFDEVPGVLQRMTRQRDIKSRLNRESGSQVDPTEQA
jgi:hypothetical protein